MEGFKSKTTYSSPINTEVKVEEKKQLSNPQFLEPQSVDSLTKSLDNISEISKDKSVLDEDFLSENERFLTTGKNILLKPLKNILRIRSMTPFDLPGTEVKLSMMPLKPIRSPIPLSPVIPCLISAAK